MLVEGAIELACQSDRSRAGFSVDIVKCFNNLPREPVGEAARIRGLPNCVMTPWDSFLTGAARRFVIKGSVGQPLYSTSGYPEGCPLSTVAMVVTGCMYHLYQFHFAPAVQCLSYVDNWVGHAASAGQAVSGLCATTCFCEALDLEIDPAKTYVWSTDPLERRALAAMQMPVLEAARELGGFFAFGRAVRNDALRQRCKALDPLFAALARSSSPLSLKMASLPTKFWARALHGIAGCPASLSLIASLRTSATKSLRILPGGASSLLRLSVHPQLDVDPGFY